ncbi:MAG: hypothetical protein R2788_21140 [Saprospiraceae bacterium]
MGTALNPDWSGCRHFQAFKLLKPTPMSRALPMPLFVGNAIIYTTPKPPDAAFVEAGLNTVNNLEVIKAEGRGDVL